MNSTPVGRLGPDIPFNWCARNQQGNNLSVATGNAPGSGVNLDKSVRARVASLDIKLLAGPNFEHPKIRTLTLGGGLAPPGHLGVRHE